MICQFSFKNFKCYRDETTFDFQATAIPEFSDSLIIKDKSSDLLPVSVIYGPNGGGKTTLLEALSFLISIVTKPICDLEKNRLSMIMQQKISYKPFIFDNESAHNPTEFRIYFRNEENEYCYYLSLFNDEIIAESLDRKKLGGKRPAHIFDREREKINLGSSIKKSKINTSVNAKMPFLSFLAINYNLSVISEVQEWFESCIIRSYANPIAELEIMISDNKDIKRKIIQLLNDVDIDINDYTFDKEKKQLYVQRKIEDKIYKLEYEAESDGTKKLIAVLPVLLIALQEGRLVIIDELDAKLHPKLLRYIILLFKNPNVNMCGAQLLFTSHDMSTMKNTVFRRDEIWFAAADENHVSEIYSLYDIRYEHNNEHVNSTASFDKQYLEGRYGADPYLQNILNGGEWQ
ncbi:MAG: ATP/GTP-binding protein [bacterium]